MRKVIKGKTYDTDTVNEVAKYETDRREKDLTVKQFDKIITVIVTNMQDTGANTEAEAHDALTATTNLCTNPNQRMTLGLQRVMEPINEEYVYAVTYHGRTLLRFKHTDKFEDFENRLREVGMI